MYKSACKEDQEAKNVLLNVSSRWLLKRNNAEWCIRIILRLHHMMHQQMPKTTNNERCHKSNTHSKAMNEQALLGTKNMSVFVYVMHGVWWCGRAWVTTVMLRNKSRRVTQPCIIASPWPPTALSTLPLTCVRVAACKWHSDYWIKWEFNPVRESVSLNLCKTVYMDYISQTCKR